MNSFGPVSRISRRSPCVSAHIARFPAHIFSKRALNILAKTANLHEWRFSPTSSRQLTELPAVIELTSARRIVREIRNACLPRRSSNATCERYAADTSRVASSSDSRFYACGRLYATCREYANACTYVRACLFRRRRFWGGRHILLALRERARVTVHLSPSRSLQRGRYDILRIPRGAYVRRGTGGSGAGKAEDIKSVQVRAENNRGRGVPRRIELAV